MGFIHARRIRCPTLLASVGNGSAEHVSGPVSRVLSPKHRTDGHLSGMSVARHLDAANPSVVLSLRTTWSRRAASPLLLGLAPDGVYRAAFVSEDAVGSYPAVSPLPVTGLPGPLAVCSLWHFPSGYPAWALPSILPCGARTFLTSCEARPSGPLTNGCFYTRTSSFQTSIRPQFSQRRSLSVRRASTNSCGESCLKHPPQEPFLTATAATPPLTTRRIRS